MCVVKLNPSRSLMACTLPGPVLVHCSSQIVLAAAGATSTMAQATSTGLGLGLGFVDIRVRVRTRVMVSVRVSFVDIMWTLLLQIVDVSGCSQQ